MQLERAMESLKCCETQLRQLVVEAAAVGDYDAVLTLTDWARAVSSIRANPTAKWSSSKLTQAVNGRPRVARSAGTRRSRKGRKTRRSKYPKFARLSNELVKIGWSKKEKSEYQHKAPRQIIDSLVNQIVQVAREHDLFTTEEIFPLRGSNGESVPSYQAYLVLAWLKAIGFLNQRGRQGYSLNAATQRAKIDKEWANLPSV